MLTKEEVESGVSGNQFTAGLHVTAGGTWGWDNEVFNLARDWRPWPVFVAPPVVGVGVGVGAGRGDEEVTSIAIGAVDGDKDGMKGKEEEEGKEDGDGVWLRI